MNSTAASARHAGTTGSRATIRSCVTGAGTEQLVVAFVGPGAIRGFADDDTVLSTLAIEVFGAPGAKFVDLAVLTSGLVCTQALIIYVARMVLSMVHVGALPERLGRVHPASVRPTSLPPCSGVAAIAWYVTLNVVSKNFLFERYPLTPIERYARWRRPDGLPFDPWMRVHARLGAEVLRPEPRSLRITGAVAEWERWTGLAFPESGHYTFPRGLAPVWIDREGDRGTYFEPNVWMRHRLGAGAGL